MLHWKVQNNLNQFHISTPQFGFESLNGLWLVATFSRHSKASFGRRATVEKYWSISGLRGGNRVTLNILLNSSGSNTLWQHNNLPIVSFWEEKRDEVNDIPRAGCATKCILVLVSFPVSLQCPWPEYRIRKCNKVRMKSKNIPQGSEVSPWLSPHCQVANMLQEVSHFLETTK